MEHDWMEFLATIFTDLQMSSKDEMQLGHILFMLNNFTKVLGPSRFAWVMKHFCRLRGLDEKFSFIWKLPEASQCLIPPMTEKTGMKADDEANRLKEAGNILFKQKQLNDALKCYTLAILRAPHPELSSSPISPSASGCKEEVANLTSNVRDMTKYETLALSYANRSAVLLEMKKYDKCLQDIELALEYGYPELLKSKILKRKKRCLSAQRQENADKGRVERDLPVLSEPNRTIPSLSSSLKLAYSKEKGRHVVALRDIHPGEVIAVEESPFTFIHFDRRAEYCLVCSRVSEAPLPCPTCWMGFCSETCRTTGLRDFHHKECKLHPGLIELGLDKDTHAILGLTVLLRTPIAEINKKLKVLLQEAKVLSPEKLGFNSDGIYSSADYSTIYHMPLRRLKKSKHVTFTMCLIAVVLTKLLCKSEGVSFTSHNLPESIFQEIITKGTVIFHILQNPPRDLQLKIAKVNAFGDDEWICIGEGLFPSVALMNHSCKASTFWYNVGPVMIVRAVRSIPAGKEVTISYGPGFETTPKVVRNQILENISRNCSCEACVKDWPMFSELPDVEFLCFKCSEALKEDKCDKCEIDYSKLDYEGEKKETVKQFLLRLSRYYQAAGKFEQTNLKLITNQPVTKAEFDNVCKFAVMLENNIKFPSQVYFVVRETIAKYSLKY